MRTIPVMILILVCFLSVTSCSKEKDLNYTLTEKDGIKYFSNQNRPSDPDLTIEPKLIFTIDGDSDTGDSTRIFTSTSDMDIDDDGNIYIFDNIKGSIKKFDSSGNYIKSFGKRGQGPGEFPVAFDLVVQNGIIYVQSFTNLQMVKFDPDGNYIENVPYESGGLVVGEGLRSVPGSPNILGYVNATENREGVYYFGNNLVIFGPDFKKLAVLREWNEKFDPANVDFFKSICKYTAGNGKIYVAENSLSDYRINVFDYSGKRTEEIRFPYARIQNNDEEENYIKKNLRLSVDGERLEQKRTYKRSVNEMFVDKFGRLLVRRSFERNENNRNKFIADVFKDGVYLNTVTIPGLIGEDTMVNFSNSIHFRGNRIYQNVHAEAKVNVYEY